MCPLVLASVTDKIVEPVGRNWEDWRHKLGYLDYVVLVAILAGVVYAIVKRRRATAGNLAAPR